MTLPAEGTLLIMSGIGVPLYSARGLVQTLTPVQEVKPPPRRTVNGELVYLGLSQMRKYESIITCTDQHAPAFGGLWPGEVVLVNCVAELAYENITGVGPERTVVPGSSREQGNFIYYRPQISFMVVDFAMGHAEYSHDYQWQLTLREN
jgi:hypothetical protein